CCSCRACSAVMSSKLDHHKIDPIAQTMNKAIMFKPLVVFLFLLLFSNLAQAGGLAVSPGEVVIENLRIGQTYNLTREKGIPVSVTNTSSSPIELKIEALAPTPGEKREGYDPIPDPSWLKIGQDQFRLEPRRSVSTDVTISIPADEQYLGKKYQAIVWSHTAGAGMIQLGLKTRVLIEISSERPETAAVAEAAAEIETAPLPITYLFQDIPVGKPYKLDFPFGTPGQPDTYSKYSLSLESAGFTGYHSLPDTNWISLEKSRFDFDPDTINMVKLDLNIPADEAYYNQHWVIDLKAMGISPEDTSPVVLTHRLLLETEVKEEPGFRPAGLIGLAPGRILLDNVLPGTGMAATLNIYNNDTAAHTYKLVPVIPQADENEGIALSPGYEAIPDPGWITLDQEELNIKGGGTMAVTLKVTVPEDKSGANQWWEAILLVESEIGETNFLRLQIRMIQ
ncbi:MAG: hypothetical protein QME81_13665, partial [bacterium]|nr:hypothetical protein [bacterium]